MWCVWKSKSFWIETRNGKDGPLNQSHFLPDSFGAFGIMIKPFGSWCLSSCCVSVCHSWQDKWVDWAGHPPPSLNPWPVASLSPSSLWTSPTLREYYIALILKAFEMGSKSQHFVFSCQKPRCCCGTIKIVTRDLLGFDWRTNTLILKSRIIKDLSGCVWCFRKWCHWGQPYHTRRQSDSVSSANLMGFASPPSIYSTHQLIQEVYFNGVSVPVKADF